MKNSSFFFLLSFCLFAFSSCQTVVDLDLPEKKPSLAVNCFFNPDSVFLVNVSKSQYVLDNAAIKKIDNATVSLYEESSWIENLPFTSDGNYRSSINFRPQAGKNYQLKVSADEFNAVESSDAAPYPTQIIRVDTGNFFFENQKYFELKVRFKDNPAVKNYYQLQLFTKNYFLNFDSLGNLVPDTNSFFQPSGFQSRDLIFDDINWFGNSGAMFTDELFSAKGEYEVSLYTYAYSDGYDSTMKAYVFDELRVDLKSVSKPYYNYVLSYQKYQMSNGNPFAEPVQVYNNIKNGYGIFAGYSAANYVMKLN